MSDAKLNLLIMSTPVGPLGSGLGGGVELTLTNLVQVLKERCQSITVVAPAGSTLPHGKVVAIEGTLQPTAHTQDSEAPIVLPHNSVLANMWEYARQVEANYDLILNVAYDWLPFYLTPFFQRPIAQFISMGSLNSGLDQIMAKVAQAYPGTLGVYTQTQAETFPFSDRCRRLGSAVDLSLYEFCPYPGPDLVWMGRISPEKGLEDAIAACQTTGIPLKILGKIEDVTYWEHIQRIYPTAPFEYVGFLPTTELQAIVRQCRGLLMTPRWIEAFGNVAIEALACGVPVIAYRRGGPQEIVRHGETGWLVEPDSVPGLVNAIQKLDQIDRQTCRSQAETEYSLTALGDRFEAWFSDVLERKTAQPVKISAAH